MKTTGSQVLVIDDEQDIRDALAEFLQDEGYTVAQAENGQRALDYLSANPHPSLILVDYMMPIMGGAEFCQKLRADPALKAIPAALISAALISDEQIKSMNLEEHLHKPLEIESLLQVIEKYCLKTLM
jgi:CheY-like chemotaxis protein